MAEKINCFCFLHPYCQVQLPWGKLPGRGQVFPEQAHPSEKCSQDFQSSHLWGSWSSDKLFSSSDCKPDYNNSHDVSTRCNAGNTTWTRSKVWWLTTDFETRPRWTRKASHSLQSSPPRDKGRPPGRSSCPHNWLRARRWSARPCCSRGSRSPSRTRWARWTHSQRSR